MIHNKYIHTHAHTILCMIQLHTQLYYVCRIPNKSMLLTAVNQVYMTSKQMFQTHTPTL